MSRAARVARKVHTDQLVLATEEQDVESVLYWLGKIKEENSLEAAINNKHSEKGYSALESTLKSPFTQPRKLILEILLLHATHYQLSMMIDIARGRENLGALQVLLNWEISGKQEAQDAQYLLAVPLEDAAKWISSNLPHTNLETLNEDDSTTPAPNPLRVPRSEGVVGEIGIVGIDEHDHSSASSNRFSPLPPRPHLSVPPALRTFLSRSTTPSFAFSNHSSFDPASDSSTVTPDTSIESSPRDILPFTARLQLNYLSPSITISDIKDLFQKIAVPCSIDWNEFGTDFEGSILVDVQPDQVAHCINLLDGLRLDEHVITCSTAHTERSFSTRDPYRRRPRRRPSRDPDYSRESTISLHYDDEPEAHPSTPIPSNNLLVLNLPLRETSQALDLLDKFPDREVYKLHSREQAVAFIRTTSSEEAESIVKEYNGKWVNGGRIWIVYAEEGLGAEEAVRTHFGKEDITGEKSGESGR
ncbi:hypothetical protein JCM5353_007513 [Sporobolomyces roseus]